MTYVWHYLIGRLLYEELIRRGGALAVLVAVVMLVGAVAWLRRRRAKRQC